MEVPTKTSPISLQKDYAMAKKVCEVALEKTSRISVQKDDAMAKKVYEVALDKPSGNDARPRLLMVSLSPS